MRLFFVALLGLFSVLMSPVSNADNFQSDFQSHLNTWRNINHVPAVILIVNTPKNQGTFTSGTLQHGRATPITNDALFGVGSLTKTFISAMILKLESEGKLSIHDPLQQYLPQYPHWKDITLQELLNMTSGIFNFTADRVYQIDQNRNFLKPWTTDDLINLAYQHPTDFAPGQSWHYSNTNYLLLGKVIEKVTHESVGTALSETFFEPLQLTHTFYTDQAYSPDVLNQMARGYENGLPPKAMVSANIGPASGGMLMSGPDLFAWMQHLFVLKDVLPPAQMQELLTGEPIPYSQGRFLPSQTQYGLGIYITQDPHLGQMIWYTGVTPWHSAVMVWVPRSQISMICAAAFDHQNDENFDMLFPQKPLVHGV
ncbi:MAG: class A beta-lactamase-related serine hydrolase, partial [Gammaproteobacteria bacterium]|nr:class A beta-lactamase-related serine hydrolase [Gammaproteobacteria bacterium]